MNLHKQFLFFLFAATCLCAEGKDSTRNGVPAIVLQFGTGFHAGVADLGKRFPVFSTLPATVFYRNSKDFYLGFEYQRFLGNRFFQDSMFGGIIGPSQQIVDINGNPSLIRYYMRGFTWQIFAGKGFSISPDIKYGKIRINAGFGFMQHFIKMRFDQGILPQLEGNYTAGYDRLSNGFMLSQQIYYQYYNVKTLSFFAGFNFNQGFTKNRRNFDYSTMRKDNKKRNDFYTGISAGVLIPINLKPSLNSDYLE